MTPVTFSQIPAPTWHQQKNQPAGYYSKWLVLNCGPSWARMLPPDYEFQFGISTGFHRSGTIKSISTLLEKPGKNITGFSIWSVVNDLITDKYYKRTETDFTDPTP